MLNKKDSGKTAVNLKINKAYNWFVLICKACLSKIDVLTFNKCINQTFNISWYFSFGFCDKTDSGRTFLHKPIGKYGNGFKSGSMRLGNDVIVFTRCETSASVGFLSQTYLQGIKAESVLVPLLEYQVPTHILYGSFVNIFLREYLFIIDLSLPFKYNLVRTTKIKI